MEQHCFPWSDFGKVGLANRAANPTRGDDVVLPNRSGQKIRMTRQFSTLIVWTLVLETVPRNTEEQCGEEIWSRLMLCRHLSSVLVTCKRASTRLASFNSGVLPPQRFTWDKCCTAFLSPTSASFGVRFSVRSPRV